MADMPGAEHTIDEALVRSLLVEQHADLADRPLRRSGNGWDNEMYRLGDDLAVRLPRRAAAAPLLLHERRWLPTLAPALPLDVPVSVRDGEPGCGYPWAWSVVAWFDGDVWDRRPPADPHDGARQLAGFLAALHAPAPGDAPENPFRGVPLADRAERFERGLAGLADGVDALRCRALFAELAATPPWDGPPCWLHGDPHPLNLVVADGRLRAVVDFGDICAGDPASDLAAAWITLSAGPRRTFVAAYTAATGIDADTWRRARAWALALGVAYLGSSDDHPAVSRIGRAAIAAALTDELAD